MGCSDLIPPKFQCSGIILRQIEPPTPRRRKNESSFAYMNRLKKLGLTIGVKPETE